jgi:chemotaxis family two-component system response regulator Rcp1
MARSEGQTVTGADQSVHVLLVEDNPGDVRLIKEAMTGSKVRTLFHVVTDGEQAMAFLRREATFADEVRPHLILMDLNLPRKDGRDVLAEIGADTALRGIPVVVLTSSAAEQDIRRSYELNANCYLTKPADLEEFTRVVQLIEDFWLSTVKLPPR